MPRADKNLVPPVLISVTAWAIPVIAPCISQSGSEQKLRLVSSSSLSMRVTQLLMSLYIWKYSYTLAHNLVIWPTSMVNQMLWLILKPAILSIYKVSVPVTHPDYKAMCCLPMSSVILTFLATLTPRKNKKYLSLSTPSI